MSDLIDRQATIDTLDKHLRTTDVPVSYPGIISALTEWLNELPSAQADSKETSSTHKALDTISRQAVIDAILAVTGNSSVRELYEHVQEHGLSDMWSGGVNAAIDIIIAVPSAQPDMSEYSDKLWKAAYERGKAEAQQRWIPCSERLPEPRMAVLGYAPRYQNIYALYYDTVCGWMVWSPIRDDCFPNSQGEIVAWMPLPKPYREEGD